MKNFRLLIMVCCVLLVGCKSTSKIKKTQQTTIESPAKPSDTPVKLTTKAEDFDKFYNLFHSDKEFQLSRVKFPIKGGIVNGESTTPWTRQNWQMLKTKIYDVDKTQFQVSYKKTDTSFFQKVWIDGAGFNVEARFQLIDGKWYLVYFLDENI